MNRFQKEEERWWNALVQDGRVALQNRLKQVEDKTMYEDKDRGVLQAMRLTNFGLFPSW